MVLDRISTCACIGENFAVRLPVVLGNVSIPPLSAAEIDLQLGGGASWEQHRAFEWGLLGGVFRRNGDEATARYCQERVALLKKILTVMIRACVVSRHEHCVDNASHDELSGLVHGARASKCPGDARWHADGTGHRR